MLTASNDIRLNDINENSNELTIAVHKQLITIVEFRKIEMLRKFKIASWSDIFNVVFYAKVQNVKVRNMRKLVTKFKSLDSLLNDNKMQKF